MWKLAVLVGMLLGSAVAVQAQEDDPGNVVEPGEPATVQQGVTVIVSPVLVVNLERMFSESLFGERVRDELAQAAADLQAENEQIFQMLRDEEVALAEQRATMEADAFRAAADAFDERAQQFRREQDAKERALQSLLDNGRQEFLVAAAPVLEELRVEYGASVVMSNSGVYALSSAIEITDEGIAAIDAVLGSGDTEN